MKNIILKFATTRPNWALLPLRVVTGLILAGHGAQKLFGWFGGYGLQGTAGFFENQLGLTPGIFWASLAAATEFFGGLMLIIGLLTRLAGSLVAITLVVAIATVHGLSFFLPSGMEFALALLAASLTLVLGGAGSASVDYQLSKQN